MSIAGLALAAEPIHADSTVLPGKAKPMVGVVAVRAVGASRTGLIDSAED